MVQLNALQFKKNGGPGAVGQGRITVEAGTIDMLLSYLLYYDYLGQKK